MARTPAVLGDGELSTGIAAIVGPVPSGERWYVTRLDFANSSSADVTVTVYTRTGAVTRQWKRATLDANGGHCEAIDKAALLEEGDLLLASASAASAVSFYAAGIKEN